LALPEGFLNNSPQFLKRHRVIFIKLKNVKKQSVVGKKKKAWRRGGGSKGKRRNGRRKVQKIGTFSNKGGGTISKGRGPGEKTAGLGEAT